MSTFETPIDLISSQGDERVFESCEFGHEDKCRRDAALPSCNGSFDVIWLMPTGDGKEDEDEPSRRAVCVSVVTRYGIASGPSCSTISFTRCLRSLPPYPSYLVGTARAPQS